MKKLRYSLLIALLCAIPSLSFSITLSCNYVKNSYVIETDAEGEIIKQRKSNNNSGEPISIEILDDKCIQNYLPQLLFKTPSSYECISEDDRDNTIFNTRLRIDRYSGQAKLVSSVEFKGKGKVETADLYKCKEAKKKF